MIIPAKWMGNSSLNKFRDLLLYTGHMKRLCWIEKGSDIFKGVSTGSICHFIWTREHQNYIDVTNITSEGENTAIRDYRSTLNKPFVNNMADSVVTKLSNESSIVDMIHRGIFNVRTNELGIDSDGECYDLLTSTGWGTISINRVARCSDISTYNCYIGQATSEHAGEPDKQGKYKIITNTGILKPGEVCTDSYIPIGNFKNIEEATNLMCYIKTKFSRYLMSMSLSGNLIKSGTFEFVPLQDFTSNSDIDWNQPISEIDKQLYKKYNLSEEEIDYIEKNN